MDRWYWKGVYHDGTVIQEGQKNPAKENKEWSSDHLDIEKLKAIVLEPKREGVSRVVMQISPGDTFKRKWRHYLRPGVPRGTCFILGLVRNGTAFHTFFRPDGRVVISTNYEASDIKSDQTVHVDLREGETSDFYTSGVGGQICTVYKLSKDGESYYNFFMPDGNVIISTSENGHSFSV